ncbi:MAG: hypothetical protein Fur0010_11410 [Bdellovibrio sp.]
MFGFEMEVSSGQGLTRDDDRIFPGENWFFYWKTSASLWQSKMAQCPGAQIIVPINWSFHSETGESYDFAHHRPETHLKKLCDLAKELGKEVIFLVPVSPVPYAPNGGIPHLLARNHSLTHDGMVLSTVDQEEAIHKIYSFFDTRVFQAYARFIRALYRYFHENSIDSLIWGFESFYLSNNKMVSLLEDHSKVFEQNFARFMDAKKDTEKEKISETGAIKPRPEQERALRKEFFETIRNFYHKELKNIFGQYVEGIVNVPFLGASPRDFLMRVYKQESSAYYARQILFCMTRNTMPSTILLPATLKQKSVGMLTKELIVGNYTKWLLSPGRYEGEEVSLYRPMRFFKILSRADSLDFWVKNGVMHCLFQNYPWCFEERLDERYLFNEEEDTRQILMIGGKTLDQNHLHQILKYFMAGGGVIIDRSGIELNILKKIELFLMENSLKVERVQFLTTIHHIALGDGRLVVVDGSQLSEAKAEEKTAFWEKIYSLFGIKNIHLDIPEGMECFWRVRNSISNELKYEEVRKLSLFNSSSYKRNMVIQLPKSFVLSKSLVETPNQIKTKPGVIELELLPHKSASLEFGVFS